MSKISLQLEAEYEATMDHQIRYQPSEDQPREASWRGISFKAGQALTVRRRELLEGDLPDGFVIEPSLK